MHCCFFLQENQRPVVCKSWGHTRTHFSIPCYLQKNPCEPPKRNLLIPFNSTVIGWLTRIPIMEAMIIPMKQGRYRIHYFCTQNNEVFGIIVNSIHFRSGTVYGIPKKSGPKGLSIHWSKWLMSMYVKCSIICSKSASKKCCWRRILHVWRKLK